MGVQHNALIHRKGVQECVELMQQIPVCLQAVRIHVVQLLVCHWACGAPASQVPLDVQTRICVTSLQEHGVHERFP